MSDKLVIVESPTKAKTIGKFLGKGYKVTSSYGHIRDLPKSAAEIPAAVKKEPWSRIGINVEDKFEPLYIIPADKKKQVKELKSLLKNCSEILLATDEDREGESISWHLLEVLKPKIPVKRLVFHEITKEAMKEALDNPREIDMNLVSAQETRRIVDRLFGYTLSPLLWKKMAPRLSAGRVQSVAMRLLVERERDRIAFTSSEYWDLSAVFEKSKKGKFEAALTHVDDQRIAIGKDFDSLTGKLKTKKNLHLTKKTAAKLKTDLEKEKPVVKEVENKPYTSKPYPPFVTSTLQQEGSRKLHLPARSTMQLAQRLYENGYITYMRTDSTTLSEEALDGSRKLITNEFGKDFLPDKPRVYKTKVKNAQEAHEAIRPAGLDFASVKEVEKKLGAQTAKLYELIWKRTLASQMKDAKGTRAVVRITLGRAEFRASGKTIEFPGYLRAYVEGSDDPEAELADQEKVLPAMEAGDDLKTKELGASDHFTQPPARFTEGSLIKELERLGIGRPSTWASVVDVVLSRSYAFKKGTALVPTFLAMALTKLMEDFFTDLVDYSFTAQLEDDLDAISRGEADSLKYLDAFYNGNGHPGIKKLVDDGAENIDPRIVCGIPLGETKEGDNLEIRIGRYGPFVSDGETRASLPHNLTPDEVGLEKGLELIVEARKGPQSLGKHPETDQPIYLKSGRFGPYVQLGDQEEGGEKPKMASLLTGMLPEEVDLETAVKLLSLPRLLGHHPETKEEVHALNGRYGPYIKSGSETRSLGDEYSPIEITFEQALELLKQPKKRGRRAAKPPLKELGKHPETEKELVIKTGRFGPYVTDGKINASVPAGTDPMEVTIEDAVNLLEARLARIAAKEGK